VSTYLVNGIDLAPFCSDPHDSPILAAPFDRGAWTCATDGIIMVRVPGPNEFPPTDGHTPTFGSVEACFTPVNGEWIPLPTDLPPLQGSRPDLSEVCDRCKGNGTTECCECGSDKECVNCSGEGTTGDPGTPEPVIPVALFTPSGDRHLFSSLYLHLISALPDLRLYLGTDPARAMQFRFLGGEGTLMPIVRDVADQVYVPKAKNEVAP
jgi:hypothetical protein